MSASAPPETLAERSGVPEVTGRTAAVESREGLLPGSLPSDSELGERQSELSGEGDLFGEGDNQATEETIDSTNASSGAVLETIFVRAAREPLPASSLSSAAYVFDAAALEDRQGMPLAEALRLLPGAAVSRSGVIGSKTEIRMRGGEANHVLVFVDGIKVNDSAQGSGFDLAHLLNQGLESVQVFPGPRSALWGSDALSGVIDVQTLSPDAEPQLEVLGTLGSASWAQLETNLKHGVGSWKMAGSAAFTRSSGHNISRNGDEKDGYRNFSVRLAGKGPLSEGLELHASLHHVEAVNEFDSAPLGLPADSEDETETRNSYGQARLHWGSEGQRWSHSLRSSFLQTDNLTRSSRTSDSGFDIYEALALSLLGEYQASFTLSPEHRFTGALERRVEKYEQRGPASSFGDPNRTESMATNSVIVEYSGRPLRKFPVLLSLRNDSNNSFANVFSARTTLAWQVNEAARLRVAYGNGVKNPTFTERFGYFTNFVGNPELKPEKSQGWEAGLDLNLWSQAFNASLTWFHERLSAEINGFVFDADSGAFTARNKAGKSLRKGLEAHGRWSLAPGLQAEFSYTWLDATEEGQEGEHVREIRRPKHSASIAGSWRSADERLRFSLYASYSGKQEDHDFSTYPAKTVQLPSFVLVTLAGGYEFRSGMEAFFRVENLFNAEFEEVYGYRSPGRQLYFGFRYHLSGG